MITIPESKIWLKVSRVMRQSKKRYIRRNAAGKFGVDALFAHSGHDAIRRPRETEVKLLSAVLATIIMREAGAMNDAGWPLLARRSPQSSANMLVTITTVRNDPK